MLTIKQNKQTIWKLDKVLLENGPNRKFWKMLKNVHMISYYKVEVKFIILILDNSINISYLYL